MARNLDGVGDYITIPDDNALDVADVFTYAIWFKRANSGVNYETLFSKGDFTLVPVFGAAAGGNNLEVYQANVGLIANSTNTITDTTWHALMIAKNGATSFKIFIDGTDVTGAVTNRTLQDNTRQQGIGVDITFGNPTANTDFGGDLAEFAVWKGVVLDQTEATRMAQGYSALFFRNGLSVYSRIIGAGSTDADEISGLTLTATNTTQSTHPNIIYPGGSGGLLTLGVG